MPAPVVALDIGGTKLAAGVISPAGQVLAEEVAPTESSSRPPEIIEALFGLSERAVGRAAAGRRELVGVGVSFGGPVDFPKGRVVTCHHLPGWEGVLLRDLIAERTGLRTVMDNDANAAALGEATFGAGRDHRYVLYVTVSTGIGGGLVFNRKVYRGARSMAGEIGHTFVAAEGARCACGRIGCLEAVASGPAIARAAGEALDAGEASILQAVPRGELTARHVAEAAKADPLAARIMEKAGEHLGLAIAGAVNLLNPDIVVIGGGVSQAGEVLLRPLREAVRRYGAAEAVRDLAIVVASWASAPGWSARPRWHCNKHPAGR